MPLLYHWVGKNYRRDLDWGAGYHLNQSNPVLHEIDLNDSLWAFTRTRAGTYVLAMELVVRAKTMNPSGYRYGTYRLWGDLGLSRYFRTDGQPDISELIRQLSVTAMAPVIGRSFQGHAAVRRLTSTDHQVLADYASPHPSPILVRHLFFFLTDIGLPVSAVCGAAWWGRNRISAVFPDAIVRFGAADARFRAPGARGIGGVRERHRMETDVWFGSGFVRAGPAPVSPERMRAEGSRAPARTPPATERPSGRTATPGAPSAGPCRRT